MLRQINILDKFAKKTVEVESIIDGWMFVKIPNCLFSLLILCWLLTLIEETKVEVQRPLKEKASISMQDDQAIPS